MDLRMDIFDKFESNVRSYCRSFPAILHKAQGSKIFDINGNQYIDLFSGAGALNYGHNHPDLVAALIEYISNGGIAHSLDMATEAKARFISTFNESILSPRYMDYKFQFTGPTGTNSVEAALKIARKYTGRQGIISFTNAFHGMTQGSLSITGSKRARKGAGTGLNDVYFMPYFGYFGDTVDTISMIDKLLDDPSSGVDKPAAFVLETVQAEGGVNVASSPWLEKIAELAKRHDALLIIDDIQVGCGRVGTFFSFENCNISPDIICLSKSLSGLGLPMSLVLMKPKYDVWTPGEHNGTFRGNNYAFVTATTALKLWETQHFHQQMQSNQALLEQHLAEIADVDKTCHIRGRGMIKGIEWRDPSTAKIVARNAYSKGIIIETAGNRDQVLKFLPALNIPTDLLHASLEEIKKIVQKLVHECIGATSPCATFSG